MGPERALAVSAILAAIACGFLGMAVGAAIQRWGDGVKASEHLGLRPQPEWTVNIADLSETEYAALASLWERSE